MTPRRGASERERDSKRLLRAVFDALATLTGKAMAERAGVGYKSLQAQATTGPQERPNIPSVETLRRCADYLVTSADELYSLARRLRDQADAIAREQAGAGD